MVMPKIVRPQIIRRLPNNWVEILRALNSSGINSLIKSAVIEILKHSRMPKYWFSSENHYLVYNQYFRGYPYEIWVSDNYIFVRTFTPVITSLNRARYYWSDYEREKARNDMRGYVDEWLFGINSDGKLFVNHINRNYWQELSRIGATEKVAEGVIRIVPVVNIISDNVIRNDVLHYHQDSDRNEYTILSESGSYRVQGEVVFDYEVYDIERIASTIAERFVNSVLSEINRTINLYIYMRIRDWLMRFGISTVLHSNITNNWFSVVVPECATNNYARQNDEIAQRIANEIAKIFTNDVDPAIPVNNWIRSEFSRRRFERHADLIITVHNAVFRQYHELYYYVRNEVKRQLMYLIENRVVKTYHVYHGNHLITIESIPLEFSVDIPKHINPLSNYYPEEEITISGTLRNDREFYVLQGYRAILYHDEHGAITVEFDKPGKVEIGNTFSSQLYINMLNRIGVKRLIESLKKGGANA